MYLYEFAAFISVAGFVVVSSSVVQYAAVCYSVLHDPCKCRSLPFQSLLQGVLQAVVVRCSALHCFAVCCIVLQCVALCCSVLQCVTV